MSGEDIAALETRVAEPVGKSSARRLTVARNVPFPAVEIAGTSSQPCSNARNCLLPWSATAAVPATAIAPVTATATANLALMCTAHLPLVG